MDDAEGGRGGRGGTGIGARGVEYTNVKSNIWQVYVVTPGMYSVDQLFGTYCLDCNTSKIRLADGRLAASLSMQLADRSRNH
jgi:hypothetical protein